MAADRFPYPSEVNAPAGGDGWEEMYSWYHLFRPERAQEDESRFWFHDALHHPDPLYPYDEIHSEAWWHGLGAFNTRIFAIPPAYGVDQRVVNGYLYIAPIPVTSAEEITERADLYQRRAGHYYENWDEIYEAWKDKVTTKFDELRRLDFKPLPRYEDESVVFEHRGYSSGFELMRDYDRLILGLLESVQYHFELLNVGYAAYLAFFEFAKQAFPSISDQSIARMVGGLKVDLYRPDDELKRLAGEAEQLGVGDVVLDAPDPDALFQQLRSSGPGRAWLEDWEATSDPWFRVNTDAGHPSGYHTSATWLEDQRIPLAYVKEYVRQLRRGEDIGRPTTQVLEERGRIAGEYADLLSPEDRKRFDELVELARKVFVYIEEHVLYIEHWIYSAFWEKSKELAGALTAMGCFDDPEDMFFLRRYEVSEAIYDTIVRWATGTGSPSKERWIPIIEKRRAIHDALKQWTPTPALGRPPESVQEPFTLLLWGISTKTVEQWLSGPPGETEEPSIVGVPASPGVAEGPARVVRDVTQLIDIEDGEVLVCPATSPAWAPVFRRIAATVSDVGGIMSHTAIVCREYGLPAVVGTGNAVARIRTGQRVRVDGNVGTVTILD